MENENIDFEKELEFEGEEEKKSSARKIVNLELIFFLILGFLLGVVVKTEAAKRVTVGYDDYQINSLQQAYNFTELQDKINNKSDQNQEAAEGAKQAEQETDSKE